MKDAVGEGEIRVGNDLHVKVREVRGGRAARRDVDDARPGALAAVLQPEQFVEIGEELAREKGIGNGDKVKVRSMRGAIQAVAVVTKRLPQLTVAGRTVHTVGIPIHWGFKGVAKSGYLANTLTPFVGDGNTQTPEFKSFLVSVEKA